MKTTLHSGGATFTVEYTQSGDEYEAVVDGQPLRARLLSARDGALTLLVDRQPLRAHIASDGSRTLVAIAGQVYEFTQAPEKRARTRQREAGRLSPEVRSPMPGKILQVLVAEGTAVEAGQALVLLEAMKMENTLSAEGTAQVKKIHVAPGDLVDLGQLLVELEFSETASVSSQVS
ncbi:MAG: biotin/lipoyl-binding protein [Deltaproteobacteria bacterium]|nr:biotin/lipoyl-binding protein [Deltaproteobacteria bacterium]